MGNTVFTKKVNLRYWEKLQEVLVKGGNISKIATANSSRKGTCRLRTNHD